MPTVDPLGPPDDLDKHGKALYLNPTMAPIMVATAEQVCEVREVLHGLERVGRARQAGGWWRQA